MEMCTIWLLEALCIVSTLMIVNTSVNTSRYPNVKNTTQSSTYRDSQSYPSCKAVDGCTKQHFNENCCSHTAADQLEAWWQVDLEGLIVMEYVKIYYRVETDLQRQRFGGYQIYQSNTSDWRNGYLCYKDTTSTSAALSLTPRINCTGTAQYLTIYTHRLSGGLLWYSESAFLELCEVEVYGCPLGKYGNGNCYSDCDVGCANRLCDPETGRCLYCADGYFLSGSSCIKCPSNCYDNVCDVKSGVCSACTPGYYGSHCNRTCLFTCKNNQCIQDSGVCEDCEDRFFGSSCESCSVGCTNHVCDHILGHCRPCLNGFYGGKCDQLCPVGCKNDICTQYEGICTACKPGYYGDTCNTNCSSNCEGDICNQTSGLCTVCVAGYYGSQCIKPCEKCQRLSCDMDTGNCTSGCIDGWTGTKCDTEVVIITKWDAAVGIGIGIGSGVVLLVLVVVIIVLVRRLTVKRSDTTDSSHMADISLSRTAKELNKDQDNTYDEIATHNKEQTNRQISHDEANYEQLGRREVEIPHVYETTDDVTKT